MNISLDKARLFQNEFLVLASYYSFKYLVGAGNSHGDLSIHIERACQLHCAIMTRHGLLQTGRASAA